MIDALIEDDSLAKNCAGIIFLGTPHRGTSTFTTSGKLMSAILEAAETQTDLWRIEPGVLRDLEDTGSNLTSVSDRFARLVTTRNIRLVCFSESRQSDVSKLVPGQEAVIPIVGIVVV